jgi:two-component system repressor protein LuxO
MCDRLHVIPVVLPPLRDRGMDILLLAEDFLARFAREEGKTFSGFARSAEERLVSHDWPGNVRELENLLRQAVVLCEEGEITGEMLPSISGAGAGASAFAIRSDMGTADPRSGNAMPMSEPQSYSVEPLWLSEKKAIERAIALCRGNITAAAQLLEINASTIYRKKSAWEKSETKLLS